ncbi:MAG: ATP synthase F1 subunit epsilon [Candidatus Methylumidiphilus sp.]
MNTPGHRTMQVDIADVSQQIYAGPCLSLVAPAALGEVCILPRHTPFLSKLVPGEIRLQTEPGERLIYYVSGGYLEVKSSTVTVLADRMLRSEQIDREAALAAKARAERTLKTSPLDHDRDQARLELLKALAQLQVLEHADIAKLRKHRR